VTRPATRQTLIDAAESGYVALLALVDTLPPGALEAEFAFEDRDRCARDVLGHLHAWHLMVLRWFAEGMAGSRPAILGEGYAWRTLPALNAEIWSRCQDADLATTRVALDASHRRVLELVAAHTDEELFTKRRIPWTRSTSLAAYLVSATSSHYDWAAKKLRRHRTTSAAASTPPPLSRPGSSRDSSSCIS